MSKEFTPSINVPETARFGPPNAQFYFRSVAELIANPIPQIITEPQNKPLIQIGGEQNELDAIKEQAAKEECINLTGKPCPDEPESKPALPKTDTIFSRDGELISKTIDSPKIEKPAAEKNEPKNATITNDDIEQRHLNKTYEGAYRDGDEQMPLDQEQRIVGELDGEALVGMVPPREHLPAELVGIGLLAGTGLAAYAGRERVRSKSQKIARSAKKQVDSAITGVLNTGLDFEFGLEAITGKPIYFFSDIVRRRIEKTGRYESVIRAWEHGDVDDLKLIARQAPNGVELMHATYRAIRDLHKMHKQSNLSVIMYLLSYGTIEEGSIDNNESGIDINKNPEHHLILTMNGSKYSTGQTLQEIIEQIQQLREEHVNDIPKSLIDRILDRVGINPTVK